MKLRQSNLFHNIAAKAPTVKKVKAEKAAKIKTEKPESQKQKKNINVKEAILKTASNGGHGLKKAFGQSYTWYKSRRIAEKLVVSFVAIALVSSLLVGIVGVVNIVQINKTSQDIYTKNTVPLKPLYKIQSDYLTIQADIRDLALQKENYDVTILSSLQQDSLDQLKNFSKDSTSDADRVQIQKLVNDINDFYQEINTMSGDFRFGNTDDGYSVLNKDVAKTNKDFGTTIDNLFQVKMQQAKDKNEANQRQFITALILMIVVLLISVGLSVLLGILLARMISRPIRKLMVAADSISAGDIDVDIDIVQNDETGKLAGSFAKITASLKHLKTDVDKLIGAALQGKLDVRADIETHQGAYREIIDGVNQAIDAITDPLTITAQYIDRISSGDIPTEIPEDFKGDFNVMKNNLSTCMTGIRSLVADANMLSDAAVRGELSARADASRHKGDYRRIIEGVNATLDAITSPLNTAADYIDRISSGNIPEPITEDFAGDFNIIKNNLNTCISSINNLIDDSIMLSEAAVAGELSARADAQRHNGDYRRIIEGVNATLDAITSPLNTAANYMERISVGDIPEAITEEYRGDFARIRESLNTCISAIDGMIDDVDMLAHAAADGNLSVHADATRHHGEFRNIIEGVNNALDAFLGPVKESAAVLEEVAKGNLDVLVTGDYKGDLAQMKNALNSTISSLAGYIEAISSALSQMASGNLDVEITGDFMGDFAQIKVSIENIVTSLNDTLREIQYAADEVAMGSRQVSDGSQQLSQGATEQASAIEQLTASIAEIADRTKQNAVSAGKANEVTSQVKDDAENGNQQMQQMLTAVKEIRESSAGIQKIIKVIDDIAFQTNILALNAAVEAARAGQYGKGFAVVAEEVRNLAAKSAEAAKQTTDLLENSMKKSELGMNIAQGTAGALKKIVSGIEKSADIVSAISAASNEQAAGIAQINRGVDQVSQVVQTNSATAEESAASSEELSGQSEVLKEKVGRFTLKQA